MGDPVGEDAWLALIDEASGTAGDLEQRVEVVELCKRAIAAEPWSNKLWLAYCEWVWSLYTDCQNSDAEWPEEEQMLGQELFSLETAVDVWQQGAQATKYRLNDSHELWNRWMSIELEQLSKLPSKDGIDRIRNLFLDRLQTPHSAWDDTSSMFSSFLTKHDEASWEATMVEATKLSKAAKEIYSDREIYELKLLRAAESGDSDAVKSEMLEYLNWEVTQVERKPKKGAPASPAVLCVALYERALSMTSLSKDPSVWEDYIGFLSNNRAGLPDSQLPEVLSVVQRSTKHCPWSGTLWARYVLCAESENFPFVTMEQIKHAATNTKELDRDGITGVIEFYVAWCGYLKRLALASGATDEDIDVAEMGLPTALEDVQQWGKRRHGKEWNATLLFPIERIIIQHHTQNGSFPEARDRWQKLVRNHGRSYEFWEQFYSWEMTVWDSTKPPTLATEVLLQAVKRRDLDWPEKVMETYVRHCNTYEEVKPLLRAISTVHRTSKQVAHRRERENAEAAALYAQQPTEQMEIDTAETEAPLSASKRKRDLTEEIDDGAAKKKAKNVDEEALREQHLKRDRENTTVLVTNLPAQVGGNKVRQYFKEYGYIISMTLETEADKESSTALIEFKTPEEARAALLRDAKYFADRQISVAAGTGLTIYVTNFPPTADNKFFHDLYSDCGQIFSIRWPSLKANTRRRFCYISFKDPEAAAAATQLDGKTISGRNLVSKYSNPAEKQARGGATAEGRELHISSLDVTINDDELRTVFGKYGAVERVNILGKGSAFVSYEKKEEATAALELDGTKLKSKILKVEMAVPKNFKPISTARGTASASPAPEADGDSVVSASPAPDGVPRNTYAPQGPPSDESRNRTICLLNIPDTINDARVRALAEQYGEIIRVTLRLDHQGAIIEYADAASAGKAALALENYEIAPGRNLRTGDKKDLFNQKDEIKTDKIQYGTGKKSTKPSSFSQPAAPIKRPGPKGRGMLGQKRGLGFSGSVPPKSNDATSGEGVNGNTEEAKKPKSNADFQAMFVKGTAE